MLQELQPPVLIRLGSNVREIQESFRALNLIRSDLRTYRLSFVQELVFSRTRKEVAL